MTLSTWLLYVAAVLVLTASPGPSVFYTITNAVHFGSRRAMAGACGSTSAIVGLMTLSMLGLGSVLAASEFWFSVLKWLGAAYLAYLGIMAFLQAGSDINIQSAQASKENRALFTKGLLVGASNPKALLFFGALFPQFIDPRAPQLPQFFILGATFVFFELGWLAIYAFSAARASAWLQQPGRAKLFNRLTGVTFLFFAGLVATSKRNAA